MKKLLVFGLSLAMLLSLTACHKPQAEQPTEPTTTPAATSEPVQEPTVSPEPVKDTTPEKLTSTTPAASTEPENIQPVEDAELQEPVETELFTEVNEMVYATGTVNIRVSWSVESEKLGALGKGDAVTRTGTAIEGTEADGWSRVKISDGQAEDGTERFKEVYVSTKYLSTTKPAAQQQATTKPSSGKGNNQGTQQDQDPSVKMPGGTPIGGTPTTGSTTQTPQGQPNISEPQDTVLTNPEKEAAATRALLGDLSGFVREPWD